MLAAVMPVTTVEPGVSPSAHHSEAHEPQGQKPVVVNGANSYLALMMANIASSKNAAGSPGRVLLHRSGGVVSLPSDFEQVEKARDSY